METLEDTSLDMFQYLNMLDESVYDYKIASADGVDSDILSQYTGKVTLIFNCAAGCGNIPQHSVLQELYQLYKNEPDFNIQAIVVDDFQCHGFEEFDGGLETYAEKNGLDQTPGEVAQSYGREHYGVDYAFSELTNGRFDKHSYDPEWVPGQVYEQEPHPMWLNLTGAALVPRNEKNLPHHWEVGPFAKSGQEEDRSQPGFAPLKGNFEKFLIARDGKRFLRYTNTFMLGQRDQGGKEFPWWESGDPEAHLKAECDFDNHGPFPTVLQRKGIDHSLDLISWDIDRFLAE